MKKNTLFLACCIGLMLLASCKKDPVAPTINILQDMGCVAENAHVYPGEEMLVGFTYTGENLKQIEIVLSQNDMILASHTGQLGTQQNESDPANSYTHAFTIEASGTVNIKGTVTDANGQTAWKTFNVYFDETPAPTITLIQEEGYITENAVIYAGDEVTIGFSASGKSLANIDITLSGNGNVINQYTETIDGLDTYSYSISTSIETVGTVTITGTVTDKWGKTASVSFNINCIEKPNAKFVGHYEGDILITGTVNADISNMEPVNEILEDQPLPALVDIVAGDNMNEVVATITINEQANTVKGTVDGNKVVFEAINDTFTYNYLYMNYTVAVPFNMNYSISGTLNGDQLGLEGECNGEGVINMFIITGTATIDGTIGGSLTKTR